MNIKTFFVCISFVLFFVGVMGCPTNNGNNENGTNEDIKADGSTMDKTDPADNPPQDQKVMDTTPDKSMEPSKPDTTPDAKSEPSSEMMGDQKPSEHMSETMIENTGDMKVGDGGKLTCQQRADMSSQSIKAEREKHLDCMNTADCTSVDIGTDCQGACKEPVNTAGETAVTSAVTQANQTYCQNYQKDGCSYTTPKCVNTKSVCNQKKCELMTCDQRLQKANDSIDALLKAHLVCASNADCMTINTSTDCKGACSEAMSMTGKSAMEALILELNSGICAKYQLDNCPYSTPSCKPIMAVCLKNKCYPES